MVKMDVCSPTKSQPNAADTCSNTALKAAIAEEWRKPSASHLGAWGRDYQ